ncbi:MAG: class I SAM-dependent methyltransferase [Rhodovulum sulfidophilum]|uniref:Class I SAM-dependent methyltransferase n=1 Tax=Rhodovulum sulfidophilum TaxID=35806 RepID=A0A2W5N275_RHOSU|nr:MAG: class I SAM-dependent methyltransferase [Rhodovulum sulfidophilum]
MKSFLTRRRANAFLDSCARIETGRLRVRTPEGHVHVFGDAGTEAELRINDWAAVSLLLARGDLGFGQGYVAGLWDTPELEPLMTLAMRNEAALRRYAAPDRWNALALRAAGRLLHRDSPAGARRNIRAHYDLGNEFYGEWLDPGFTYSSALFAPDDADLARGQARKYDRVLDRLGERERVLELGCGWGGFAERAAGRGHAVTALTISPSQKAFADARLDGRAEIQLRDYRAATGRYAGIVAIEMLEAVGERNWPSYFATLKARLAEGGKVVMQVITVPDDRFGAYRRGTDYIRHATFPGGALPCPGAISEGAARAGLRAGAPFTFGRDYALTCRQWARRLIERRTRLAALGHGERRLRHWRYYLETSAACFATGRADVAQLELTHA